jgi:hypothetical protein
MSIRSLQKWPGAKKIRQARGGDYGTDGIGVKNDRQKFSAPLSDQGDAGGA